MEPAEKTTVPTPQYRLVPTLHDIESFSDTGDEWGPAAACLPGT